MASLAGRVNAEEGRNLCVMWGARGGGRMTLAGRTPSRCSAAAANDGLRGSRPLN